MTEEQLLDACSRVYNRTAKTVGRVDVPWTVRDRLAILAERGRRFVAIVDGAQPPVGYGVSLHDAFFVAGVEVVEQARDRVDFYDRTGRHIAKMRPHNPIGV